MTVLTVTAKGQITLRKEILSHLGVAPGDRLDVEMLPKSRIVARAGEPAGRISDAFDLLKRSGGRRLSIDKMRRIAADGWARKAK